MLVGLCGPSVAAELVMLVAAVMEAEGELVRGVGTVTEKSCVSAGRVALVMELFMLTSVGLFDSYRVGGWTSAYRAMLLSLHLVKTFKGTVTHFDHLTWMRICKVMNCIWPQELA